MAASFQQIPKNYAPNLSVTFSGTVSLFGKNVSSPLVLQEPGYYEFMVVASNKVYPVCVVDSTTLKVAIDRIVFAGDNVLAFKQMKEGLSDLYPKGKRSLPYQEGAPYQVLLYSNAPAVYDLRLMDANNQPVSLGSILATKSGVSLSPRFDLPLGLAKLRLAVVITSGPLVLT